jgi:hypothetical protein
MDANFLLAGSTAGIRITKKPEPLASKKIKNL